MKTAQQQGKPQQPTPHATAPGDFSLLVGTVHAQQIQQDKNNNNNKQQEHEHKPVHVLPFANH